MAAKMSCVVGELTREFERQGQCRAGFGDAWHTQMRPMPIPKEQPRPIGLPTEYRSGGVHAQRGSPKASGLEQTKIICHLGLALNCLALPLVLELAHAGLRTGLPSSPCFCSS